MSDPGSRVARDEGVAAKTCEHYWAYHVFQALTVRLCMTCHEPDWEWLRWQQVSIRATAWDLAHDEVCPDNVDCTEHRNPYKTEDSNDGKLP